MKVFNKIFILPLLAVFAFPIFSFGAPYTIDPSFTTGTGFNNGVRGIVVQPDGKYLMVGSFSSYNGSPASAIVRLNTDGTKDSGFNYGTGLTGGGTNSTALVYTSQNKVITSGNFTNYNGSPVSHIVGINDDGTLDTGFSMGSGFSPIGSRRAVEQPDGKIIITGDFTSYNGTTANRIIRLNTDGSIDSTFNTGTGFNNFGQSAIVIQPDGKIVVGANSTNYNGTAIGNIVRLNADGTVDSTFNASGSGFAGGLVTDILLEASGKMLVGGYFTSYNGTTANRIIRLNADGSIDSTFNSGTGFDSGINSYSIKKQSDGKYVIGGNFTSYNGISRNGLVRLNSDGSLDTTFDIGTGFGSSTSVVGVNLLSGGRILVTGFFTTYNGTTANRIVMLMPAAPSAPTTAPDLTTSTDSGTSNTDNITNDTTPDFTGTCTDGETVTLYIDNVAITPTQVCSGSTYTITPSSPIAEGPHTIESTFTNIVGESPKSPTLNFTIDTTAPTGLTITGPTDGATGIASPTDVTGVCTNGNTVTVNPGALTTICALGTYTVSTPFSGSPQTITVTETDPAGNTSSPVSVTINTPVVTSGGGGAVLILTPLPTTTTPTNTQTNTNTPSSNPGKTYISPIDNTEKICPGFTQYLRKGSRGGEVKLLQAFLNKKLNKTIPLTSYFGNQTESAVREYQLLNKSTVMTPWGLTSPTGWWYQSTRFQANKDITCSEGTVKLDNGIVIKD